MPHESFGERCAVLGSGMAGLFAARVLSDHFDQVVLIDRDEVRTRPPSVEAYRKASISTPFSPVVSR